MALQFAELLRNARLDAIETHISTDAILRLRTGAKPADVAAGDTGTILCEMTLPSDWLAAASGGQKAKAGTWQGTGQNGPGDVGHFRIYTSGGTAKIQGSVTATGGGGDMTLDNINVATGQTVTVTGFTLTDGNA